VSETERKAAEQGTVLIAAAGREPCAGLERGTHSVESLQPALVLELLERFLHPDAALVIVSVPPRSPPVSNVRLTSHDGGG
jgi:hypothetical protein